MAVFTAKGSGRRVPPLLLLMLTESEGVSAVPGSRSPSDLSTMFGRLLRLVSGVSPHYYPHEERTAAVYSRCNYKICGGSKGWIFNPGDIYI